MSLRILNVVLLVSVLAMVNCATHSSPRVALGAAAGATGFIDPEDAAWVRQRGHTRLSWSRSLSINANGTSFTDKFIDYAVHVYEIVLQQLDQTVCGGRELLGSDRHPFDVGAVHRGDPDMDRELLLERRRAWPDDTVGA